MKTFIQTTAFTLMLLLASLAFTSDSVADDGSNGSNQNTGRLVKQPPLPPGSPPFVLGEPRRVPGILSRLDFNIACYYSSGTCSQLFKLPPEPLFTGDN